MKRKITSEITEIQESCESENLINLIKIVKHWRRIPEGDLDLEYLEMKACEFMRETYHDTDSYFLYGFMLMKYFERLDVNDENVKNAFELTHQAVVLDREEDSIECLRKVFGEEFPYEVFE